MSEPIKAGDRCLVVSGVFGNDGLNIGKEVIVDCLRGDHSEFGRIWRCSGVNLITEYGNKGKFADFAVSWLKKLPKESLNMKKTEVLELTKD
jgi:hypothetical protein